MLPGENTCQKPHIYSGIGSQILGAQIPIRFNIVKCPPPPHPPGDTLILHSYFAGNPEPEIEWYLNGNIIFEDDKWRMNFYDDGTCSLILKDAQQEDQGKVKCVAFNESGKVSCTGVLYIEGMYISWILLSAFYFCIFI